MKLISLKLTKAFRSLPDNFLISFMNVEDYVDSDTFQPYCLVGLNGCGKSNVLEALSHIFFHLELCVGVHLPEQFFNGVSFSPEECAIDGFELSYLHCSTENTNVEKSEIELVRITKAKGKAPKMFVSYPFRKDENKHEESLIPMRNVGLPARGKKYLPKHVVAYSSGENETISIPYIKSRLIHLDEFRDTTVFGYQTSCITPENGMIYIDSNMSQAILLCCLLFENDKTLESLRNYDTTGIVDISRFRMSLQNKEIKEGKKPGVRYFDRLEDDILKKFIDCATLKWSDGNGYYLDFKVNDATKEAFKYHFNTGIECFYAFRLLYELNYYDVSKEKRSEIYESKGIYTENKFSLPYPEADVFHFLDFFITKKVGKNGEQKDILLKSFSDGEHQYIHTMAICLLLKDSDSLILLDEPETHFNPNWRSLFVSMLNESLKNGGLDSGHSFRYSNFMKEVLITSHSPFIISDCHPTNVIVLKKDENGKTKAESAADMGLQTYGASESVIMASIFGSRNTIGQRAKSDMDEMEKDETMGEKDLLEISQRFGESIEKLILMNKIKNR